MRLETTAASLSAALRLIAGVVERRSSVPILGAVRIGDGKIIGTNLDMEASILLPEVGTGEGTAAVGYHTLAALARLTPPEEPVVIAEAEGSAKVSFNGSEYGLLSYPASEFPAFAPFDGVRTLVGNAGLMDAIRRIKFAMSREETRYYLNGVAMLIDPDGKPVVAATNGHMLAIAPVAFEIEGAKGQIIPKEAVAYLARQKGEPEAVTFAPEKRRAKFEYAGLTLASKLIDGTFPDIFRVIPPDAKPRFAMQRYDILPALRRLAAVTGISRAAKFAFDQSGVTLTARTHEGGVCRETVKAEMLTDEPFDVGYSVSYMIDVLTAFRGERLTFSAPKEVQSAPCVITCDDDPFRVVLMPMRV